MSLLLPLIVSAHANALPTGEVHSFISPNKVAEACIIPAKLPQGDYSKSDLEKEQELCALDFYNDSMVLCPKLWSTSPATMVDTNSTGLPSSRAEATHCSRKVNGLKEAAKFKQSMNQADTSGTFSPSSLMYYELSRALHAKVEIPPAVYRSMDRQAHFDRVASRAHSASPMDQAGWVHVQAAETSPATYNQAAEFLTPDRKQIYGVLLKGGGSRYGAEINGTRVLNSIALQNFEMQKTPAFLALQSPLPLQGAINAGITEAFADPKMAAAFPKSGGQKRRPSVIQMNSWMRDMSEIAILDYVLGQQDRVGNINYKWVWLYRDADGTKQTVREKSEAPLTQMASIAVPRSIAPFHPVLLQKSVIADNDAGGDGRYMNAAKTSGMLDGKPSAHGVPVHEPVHHLALETYQQLQTLAKDFQVNGENAKAFSASLGLTSVTDRRRVAIIKTNLVRAAAIFRAECSAGALLFDIVSDKDALAGNFNATTATDCANP